MCVAVCFVISSVPIDLSPYAEELCKNAVPLLYSQHSETRHAAQSLLSALAKQCSDAASVKTCSNLLLTALKSKVILFGSTCSCYTLGNVFPVLVLIFLWCGRIKKNFSRCFYLGI